MVGPGVISTIAEEFKATVSPDNSAIMYVVTDHRFAHMTIVEARRAASGWSEPEVASFSGIWRDGDPSFAPDGKTLYFISNRPLPGDSAGTIRREFNMWSVKSAANGSWAEPVPLDSRLNTGGSAFAPSVTARGDLYYSRGDSIYSSKNAGGGFANPIALPLAGGDPAISADGNMIVFDADHTPGDSDIFLSCRAGGTWSAPRRFREPVNSPAEEGDPSISPDGKTLYYFSTRYTRGSVRAPRPKRVTYAELKQEALASVENGSRNLYQVDISALHCPISGG